MFTYKAYAPTAVLYSPVVLSFKASVPTAVLLASVSEELDCVCNAPTPTATLWSPCTSAPRASCPIATLLFPVVKEQLTKYLNAILDKISKKIRNSNG